MRTHRRSLTVLTLIAGGALPASGAMAQEGGASDEGGAEVTQIAPLQGPEVMDERAPGTDSRFSMGMQRARESERPIPLRVYERELKALNGAGVDESLRVTIEQRDAIRKIIREHRVALRAFYAEHREEIAAIRGAGKGAGAAGDTDRPSDRAAQRSRRARDGANTEKMPSDRPDARGSDRNPGGSGPARVRGGAPSLSPEARARMQALRAKGPQESAAITRIWETLNQAQRDHLEARFEAVRAESMRRSEAQKREGGEKNDASPRERFESMTPEQRRELRERVERRRDSSGGEPASDD